jgi:hypothetical protein
MSRLFDKNNVSVKVNNFIRNQDRKDMTRIAGLDDEQIRKIWEKQLMSG